MTRSLQFAILHSLHQEAFWEQEPKRQKNNLAPQTKRAGDYLESCSNLILEVCDSKDLDQ